MRPCDEILELISAALDGELTEKERQELDAHLDACPACSALYQELSGLRDAAAGPEEAPAGFAGQVMARIAADPAQERPESVIPFPAKQRSRVPWKGWAATAAVVAVVVLGALALPGRQNAGDTMSSRSANSAPASGGAGNSEIAPESDEMGELDVVFGPNPQAEEPETGGAAAAADQEAPTPAPKSPPAETDSTSVPEGAPAVQAASEGDSMACLDSAAIYCGVLLITGEPLPEGLEEFEAKVDEDGAVAYLVPASYFYANSSRLADAMVSNYIDCSQVSNTDPTAEYGLIIVELPSE